MNLTKEERASIREQYASDPHVFKRDPRVVAMLDDLDESAREVDRLRGILGRVVEDLRHDGSSYRADGQCVTCGAVRSHSYDCSFDEARKAVKP